MDFANINIEKLKRVAVIGASCSGKTTFSRNLARLLKIKHVELDAIHWLPEWTPRPDEEFKSLVEREVAADSWIIEGGYSKVREMIFARATTIIWLNYSFPVTFYRALSRTTRRIFDKEILYSNNRETFRKAFMSRDSILLWVLQSYARKRRQFNELLKQPQYQNKQIFNLQKPADANRFLVEIERKSLAPLI